MLKMEQEAAVQKFQKERMVGDGVREEDAKKNTGLRLSQRVFSFFFFHLKNTFYLRSFRFMIKLSR